MPVATQATTPWSISVIQAYLGAQDADQAQVAVIANAVANLLERETRRLYVTRSLVELQDNVKGWQRTIFTRQYPIRTCTALEVKYYPYDAWSAINLTTSNNGPDADIAYAKGRIFLKQWWYPRGLQAIRITYTAGYGAQDSGFPAETAPDGTPMHDGMQQAYELGLEICKFLWDSRSSNSSIASSISLGSTGNLVIKADWPLQIKLGLQGLVRPVAG